MGRRLLMAFAITMVFGWIACSMVLFGTTWDGRFDSEDHLVAHFLKWYSLAYAIVIVSSAAAMWATGGLIWWVRIGACTLVGVVFSAVLTAELARADALSIVALPIVLALPACCGGWCLSSVLKRVTLTDHQ